MAGTVDIFVEIAQQFTAQLASFIPKVIVAILIWYLGKYLLNLAAQLLKKVDVKGLKIDKEIIALLTRVVIPLGKLILVLVILDYLGIGRTVIGAFMNGLSLAIAIGLGIAFGRALQEDAGRLVSEIKKHFEK